MWSHWVQGNSDGPLLPMVRLENRKAHSCMTQAEPGGGMQRMRPHLQRSTNPSQRFILSPRTVLLKIIGSPVLLVSRYLTHPLSIFYLLLPYLKMNFFRDRYMFMMTCWVSMKLCDIQIRSRQNLFSGNCLVVYFQKLRAIAIWIAWSLAEISG